MKFMIRIFAVSILISWCLCADEVFTVKLTKNLVIGGEEDELFYQIAGVDADVEGNIYACDMKDYSISKLNAQGELIKKIGRFGQGPGEFPDKPIVIKFSKGLVYVSMQLSKEMLIVFDKELNFKRILRFDDKVIDFDADGKKVFLSFMGLMVPFPIFTLSDIEEKESFKKKYEFWQFEKLKEGPSFEFWKKVSVNSIRQFYLASCFEDKVEKWDAKGALIWSRTFYSGQKVQYTVFKPTGGQIPDPRKSVFYRETELDHCENVYILSASSFAKFPGREVHVLSPEGEHLTTFYLDHRSSFMRIDENDNLYAQNDDEDGVCRYKMTIVDKRKKK